MNGATLSKAGELASLLEAEWSQLENPRDSALIKATKWIRTRRSISKKMNDREKYSSN